MALQRIPNRGLRIIVLPLRYFRAVACYPRNALRDPFTGLVMENDIEQRTVDLQSAF